MKSVIITEGRADQLLLERLLESLELPKQLYQVVAAGGRSSAESLARTYLADSDYSVALVLDADTNDEERVREQELILDESLRSVGPSRPFLVLLAKPEIAVCLFEDRTTAEDLFGKALADEQWTRAQFQPYRVARELVSGPNGTPCGAAEWVQCLNSSALARAARSPLITRLRDFVLETTSPVASGSAPA